MRGLGAAELQPKFDYRQDPEVLDSGRAGSRFWHPSSFLERFSSLKPAGGQAILSPMDLADYVRMANDEPGLRFLVIGGYAVAAHGHVRVTFDVDFLVDAELRAQWLERAGSSGLQLRSSNDVFAQFIFDDEHGGLDLMFVQPETFASMWDGSQEKVFGTVRSRVPSLDHLLALKLHALNLSIPHRFSKDADDVEMLIRRNRLDITSERYQRLFLKHGNQEIYDTFLRILREC
ncbi:MAG: hypothetical protein M2R45_03570 [Verrucomicrobia subdivision 3 bacterium]|nr:hypothetical protein [Limisphaerales bacterium]MCS1414797.1 hypothetical protein [Limisphaerales bacterium]